ncbi:MAG: hypothetical protein PX481_01320 [Microcystis sp. M53603_WE2]|jgi:hypothetical protein|uniref:Uncharacterized protein n=1 Tax=Microcystis aeruginosa PCC 9717 TaxID=1160286 RepID=I4FVH1_MICAE|nr:MULTISPECIES: hypothetical protein [unclassified Microcystis]MCZ8361868.1 hypothetical protein [Microcystis sp. LE19-251.1A]MDJ0563125.1 hypothetical protein [Microcystis sp. M49629_WE12]CCH99646.1 hypothetical protein MICAB_6570014 [Microcystis aeruginosa PCC 9717]MCZ8028182.1 hypothetical protein [Microcystis sp. LE19-10.1B]MDJ0537358.1 hypothetical protein [Microcystis sp. M53603_WE2]
MGKILQPTPCPHEKLFQQTLGQERKSLSVGIGDREGIHTLPANT